MNHIIQLFDRISFDQEKIIEHPNEQLYLILYFALNQSGAVELWKKTYDSYHTECKNEFSEYIGDSEYDAYCKYLELVEILTKIYTFIKYEGINYTDYLNDNINDKI